MSLDPTWLLLSLIAGGIGFLLFVYDKKQQRWPQLAAGLRFMVYPYFDSGLVPLVVIGAVIGFGLWYVIRLGWQATIPGYRSVAASARMGPISVRDRTGP